MIKLRTKEEDWNMSLKDVPESKENHYQYIVIRYGNEGCSYWYQDEKGFLHINHKLKPINTYSEYNRLPDEFKIGSIHTELKSKMIKIYGAHSGDNLFWQQEEKPKESFVTDDVYQDIIHNGHKTTCFVVEFASGKIDTDHNRPQDPFLDRFLND